MDSDNTIASREREENGFSPDMTMPGRRSRQPDAASAGVGASGGNDPQFDPDMTMDNRHGRHEHGNLNVGDVVLNRYELLEKLGSGAMGVVFKCRDQVSLVEYALKMVPPELARDAEAMDDVRRNFQLVHGLKHPNIASVDFLDRDRYGAYFLVMEYAEGESLSQWIRRKWSSGRPEPGEVADIVKQIASALDYAHSQGILHRDVKPANVMVSATGQVKVLDFGLASKVRTSMSMLSMSEDNASGTPNYLSPEQFKGRRARPASDQYALGVLTYQMLSGDPPFDAETLDVLRSAVMNEEPEPVEGVSQAVNQCLLKVLNKDPKLRFASCAEFAQELESSFGKTEGEKIPVVSIQQEEQPPRKNAAAPVEADRNINTAEQSEAAVPAEADRNINTAEQSEAAVPAEADRNINTAERSEAAAPAEADRNINTAEQSKAAAPAEADRNINTAEQSEAAAEYQLAESCFYGSGGVAKDYAAAANLYRKAAEQGYAIAQYKLGYCCEKGIGTEKNDKEAVNWYRKAADQEVVEAQNCLGHFYLYGEGVEKNYAEAAKWYRKAAEKGHAESQSQLGYCYEYGKGVPKNRKEAAKWYRKAAEQGNAFAKGHLKKKILDRVFQWLLFLLFLELFLFIFLGFLLR